MSQMPSTTPDPDPENLLWKSLVNKRLEVWGSLKQAEEDELWEIFGRGDCWTREEFGLLCRGATPQDIQELVKTIDSPDSESPSRLPLDQRLQEIRDHLSGLWAGSTPTEDDLPPLDHALKASLQLSRIRSFARLHPYALNLKSPVGSSWHLRYCKAVYSFSRECGFNQDAAFRAYVEADSFFIAQRLRLDVPANNSPAKRRSQRADRTVTSAVKREPLFFGGAFRDGGLFQRKRRKLEENDPFANEHHRLTRRKDGKKSSYFPHKLNSELSADAAQSTLMSALPPSRKRGGFHIPMIRRPRPSRRHRSRHRGKIRIQPDHWSLDRHSHLQCSAMVKQHSMKLRLSPRKPRKLLVAVTFLNKTRGSVAVPIFYNLMERFPSVSSLAAASLADVCEEIKTLGLQNSRSKTLTKLAQAWLETPPARSVRYRKLNYPVPGTGSGIKVGQVLSDDDPRDGAWEISHLPGTGPYAHDSWRIFCRDELRELATGWNGEGAPLDFEPEWKRVVPSDKELRAFLRWMWLKEGWDWDPISGEKEVASSEMMKMAEAGESAWLEREGANAGVKVDGMKVRMSDVNARSDETCNTAELARVQPGTERH